MPFAWHSIATRSANVPRRDPLPVDPFQSLAVGVGTLGKQEQPFPLMVSPKATGPESEGQDSVAKRLKAGSHSPPGPNSVWTDSGRIFSDHNSRAKCINNPEEVTAEILVLSFMDASGVAVPLAGIAPAKDIDSPFVVGFKISHILPPCYRGPMPGKHPLAMRIDLDLPEALHGCSFKPEVKAADPGE